MLDLAEKLSAAYRQSHEQGVRLSAETEAWVRQALEMAGVTLSQPRSSPTDPFCTTLPTGSIDAAGQAGFTGTGSGSTGLTNSGSTGQAGFTNSGSTRSTGLANSGSGLAGEADNGLSPDDISNDEQTSAVDTPASPDPADAVGEVFDNFAQGEPSNCGATAVIKQMQQQWGREAMTFESQPNGTLTVTMRDGASVTLTPDQIEQASIASDYTGDDPVAHEQAILMNAAAAARYSEENGVAYGQALAAINGRNYPDHVAGYFGVSARPVDPLSLDGNGMAIVSNSTHAAVVMRTENGAYHQDDHGDLAQDGAGNALPYDGTIVSNGQSTGTATQAWILGDVDESPSTSDKKVREMSYRQLDRQGYLDKLSRPARNGLRQKSSARTGALTQARTRAPRPKASRGTAA